jgi:hypothetical protein
MAHCPEGVAVNAAVDAEFSASAQVRQNETQHLFVSLAIASRLGQVCPKPADIERQRFDGRRFLTGSRGGGCARYERRAGR